MKCQRKSDIEERDLGKSERFIFDCEIVQELRKHNAKRSVVICLFLMNTDLAKQFRDAKFDSDSELIHDFHHEAITKKNIN